MNTTDKAIVEATSLIARGIVGKDERALACAIGHLSNAQKSLAAMFKKLSGRGQVDVKRGRRATRA
jgi:hypothetical protein